MTKIERFVIEASHRKMRSQTSQGVLRVALRKILSKSCKIFHLKFDIQNDKLEKRKV